MALNRVDATQLQTFLANLDAETVVAHGGKTKGPTAADTLMAHIASMDVGSVVIGTSDEPDMPIDLVLGDGPTDQYIVTEHSPLHAWLIDV